MSGINRQAIQKRKGKGKIKGVDMKGKNNHKNTAAEKSNKGAQKLPPIVPLNDKQYEYMKALENDDVCTILVSGVLGSSKTYLPSALAADRLINKRLKRVVIARPSEGKGKTIGFTKGSHQEKLMGWCAPVLDTMRQRMGEGQFQAALDFGKIELLPLEQVKGRSWDDAWIIVDEAEDLEADVAKSLVTRVGQGSKVIVTGDFAQQDLKHYSGLDLLMQVADFANLPVTKIDFDSWDYCVRSEEAKLWGMGFEAFEKNKREGK